jgi:polar amino acid transport system permease protein
MALALEYLRILLTGVGVTITVTLLGSVVTVVAATLGGLGRLSPYWVVRTLAGAYIEIFRGTSALVQMFWIFFALPLAGIELTPLQAGVLALGLNVGAYGAEVVRAGVSSVAPGQFEAGRALNLSKYSLYRYVVARQAIQLMIPPFNNLFISLLKGTSLVSLITLADLTFRASYLRSETGNSTLVLTLTLFIYLALSIVITVAMRGAAKVASYPGAQSASQGAQK